jgi:hypothetical protein
MKSMKDSFPSDKLTVDDFAIPKKGVSLHYLKLFVEKYEKVLSESKMTTEDVVHKIIKDPTRDPNNAEDQGCSLCEKLQQSPDTSGYVADATVFISHGWSYQFLAPALVILTHFPVSEHERTFIWLDIFSVNEHKTNLPFDAWKRRFEGSLKENANIQLTLMILDDSSKTTATKRMWCLLEAAHTLKTKKKLEFAFLGPPLVLSPILFAFGIQQMVFVDIIHSRCGNDEDYIRLAKMFLQDSTLALRNELNQAIRSASWQNSLLANLKLCGEDPKIHELIKKAVFALSSNNLEEIPKVIHEIQQFTLTLTHRSVPVQLGLLSASLYEKTDRKTALRVYLAFRQVIPESGIYLSLFCLMKAVELHDLEDKVSLLLSVGDSLEEMFAKWKPASSKFENRDARVTTGFMLYHILKTIDDSQSLPLIKIFKSLQLKSFVSDCRWDSFYGSLYFEGFQDNLAHQALTSKNFAETDLRRRAIYASYFFEKGLSNGDAKLQSKYAGIIADCCRQLSPEVYAFFPDNTYYHVMTTTGHYTEEGRLSFALLAYDGERKRRGVPCIATVALMSQVGKLYLSLSTEEEDTTAKEKYYNNSLKWYRQYKYFNRGRLDLEVPLSESDLAGYKGEID